MDGVGSMVGRIYGIFIISGTSISKMLTFLAIAFNLYLQFCVIKIKFYSLQIDLSL